jgi:predicted enzyme related to lactoylglutathione lyase
MSRAAVASLALISLQLGVGMPAVVSETFFSVSVRDMGRATAFYVGAFGATVAYASPGRSSLRIAGVRIGLALSKEQPGERTSIHFAVSNLAEAHAEVERASGRVVQASVEVAPGVIISEAEDTEGNTFVLTQR